MTTTGWLLLSYPTCDTCRKAKRWLQEQGIDFQERNIAEVPPTLEELKQWVPQSGKEAKAFFNTSGQVYRQGGFKDKIASATDAEMLAMLAGQGMLVKRPLLIGPGHTLVGFKDKEYEGLFQEESRR